MFYSSSTLDRADHLRKDDTMLQKLRSEEQTLLVPVWQGQSLVSQSGHATDAEALMLSSHQLKDDAAIFLGKVQDQAYFAVDVSHMSEPTRDQLCEHAINRNRTTQNSRFADLRQIGPLLSGDDGALLAYARGLVYWNNGTRHCIRCGHLLQTKNGGHVRSCTNNDCGYLTFPRTDPAVIMLVIHTPTDGSEPKCLLGRNAAWPNGVFSTLAGFVEPGESLEMAVSREVLEESAIHTTDVKYVASQPWPFPRSIMLGFTAVATSTDIKCDPEELDDAQWFTRSQIKSFGSWTDDGDGYKLPRTDSIARFLIDQWVQNK